MFIRTPARRLGVVIVGVGCFALAAGQYLHPPKLPSRWIFVPDNSPISIAQHKEKVESCLRSSHEKTAQDGSDLFGMDKQGSISVAQLACNASQPPGRDEEIPLPAYFIECAAAYITPQNWLGKAGAGMTAFGLLLIALFDSVFMPIVRWVRGSPIA